MEELEKKDKIYRRTKEIRKWGKRKRSDAHVASESQGRGKEKRGKLEKQKKEGRKDRETKGGLTS